MNPFDTLVEALEGVVRVADRRTVEFDTARTALEEAKRWEAVEGATENGDFLQGRHCVIPGVHPALLLIQKEAP